MGGAPRAPCRTARPRGTTGKRRGGRAEPEVPSTRGTRFSSSGTCSTGRPPPRLRERARCPREVRREPSAPGAARPPSFAQARPEQATSRPSSRTGGTRTAHMRACVGSKMRSSGPRSTTTTGAGCSRSLDRGARSVAFEYNGAGALVHMRPSGQARRRAVGDARRQPPCARRQSSPSSTIRVRCRSRKIRSRTAGRPTRSPARLGLPQPTAGDSAAHWHPRRVHVRRLLAPRPQDGDHAALRRHRLTPVGTDGGVRVG